MRYVILGGGIAGTTVAEFLPLFCDTPADITLISDYDVVKRAVGIQQKGEALTNFHVEEATPGQDENYKFIQGTVVDVDFTKHLVHLKICNEPSVVPFDKLCIALGGKPNTIARGVPYVVGIRDTESVAELQRRLSDSCYHVTVVGNGGIATEFVHSARDCHLTWIIRDKSISSVFVDPVAAKFFLDSLNTSSTSSPPTGTTNGPPFDTADNVTHTSKRHIFTRHVTSQVHRDESGSAISGCALGPDWYRGYNLSGMRSGKKLDIEYECEVTGITQLVSSDTGAGCTDCGPVGETWAPDGHQKRETGSRLKISLSNNKTILTDLVLSATGVVPNTDLFRGKLDLADDCGVLVDKRMRSLRYPEVFAVGDVCTIPWKESDNWQQMRLWTQARSQGVYTARSMAGSASEDDDITPDISYEIFTHSTSFFGFKVIMLGRHKEWPGCQCYFRVTENVEFIKLVVWNNRLQGALLVGETDLEETFENLILNQLDISDLGENILDPNVDIEDYFD